MLGRLRLGKRLWIETSRPASGYGRGFNTAEYRAEKTAVQAPSPTASTVIQVSEYAGRRHTFLKAMRILLPKSDRSINCLQRAFLTSHANHISEFTFSLNVFLNSRLRC